MIVTDSTGWLTCMLFMFKNWREARPVKRKFNCPLMPESLSGLTGYCEFIYLYNKGYNKMYGNKAVL